VIRSASYFWRETRPQKGNPQRSGPPLRPFESDFRQASAKATSEMGQKLKTSM
jgi:hypothetical protein